MRLLPLLVLVACTAKESTSDDSAPTDDTSTTTDDTSSTTDDTGTSDDTGEGRTGDADLGGCAVFPGDNPWNTDISGAPLHARSDAFINNIGRSTGLHPDFGTTWQGAPNGIPFVTVDASQPGVAVSFMYADESDAGPYPVPEGAPIEGGPNGSGDRHVLVVQTDDCVLYELYDAWPQSDGSWEAGSGAIFDLSSNDLRPDGWTSADAAGLPILPGLVRYEEVVTLGRIDHALRFTVSRSQRGYIHPATHAASSDTDPDRPPMGLRLRLKAATDCSGFSSEVQVICDALKTYGMFVADNGSDWYISGAPDERWSDDNLRDLRELTGGDFEVVETGAVIPY
ncbi:MAG: hypothetical protein H6739_38130 [Alphaproteobacteria bacterium]|nr:hypothetical protein [Alphaproteobacteria bacterium]